MPPLAQAETVIVAVGVLDTGVDVWVLVTVGEAAVELGDEGFESQAVASKAAAPKTAINKLIT
jgi:hypothetical protein